MPFYFQPFPTVRYDLKKNFKFEILTNITLRFKINQIIKTRQAIYFNYTIPENMKADAVAYQIYDDATLDWLIFLINDIYDPHYDWPLDSFSFKRFIQEKYGSVSEAMSQTHHYEKILSSAKVLFDGTIIPERTLEIDETTYNTLPTGSKRLVTAYEYETELNDAKRNISLIDEQYISPILSAIEDELEINE